MAALTDRQKARERMRGALESLLEKMVPANEAVPLPGATFQSWEELGEEIERTLVPMFLEERAALEASARVEDGGRCPHCDSQRVYLIPQASKIELLTPHGPVVLYKQRCRCRQCGRSFSPSRAGLEPAERSRPVPQGRQPHRP